MLANFGYGILAGIIFKTVPMVMKKIEKEINEMNKKEKENE